MSNNIHVVYRKSNGNLHVCPKGDFYGTSACALVDLLHRQYDGKGKVFIDTQFLREMVPFGCSTFQCRLNPRRVPLSRIFFKGEKAYELAPEGSEVIVNPFKKQHTCSGNCVNCKCSRKNDQKRLRVL